MKKTVLIVMTLLMVLMAGCGAGEAPAETTAAPVVLNMQELYDTVTAMENIPEMLPLDADMQLNFCGIAAEDCVQSVVAICSDGLRTDEFWFIEAADADALARIQEMAANRLTAKGEESITYSPEQYAVVQKAETVVTGNYFILLVSPEVTELVACVKGLAGM